MLRGGGVGLWFLDQLKSLLFLTSTSQSTSMARIASVISSCETEYATYNSFIEAYKRVSGIQLTWAEM
jgi:hypothetical protein